MSSSDGESDFNSDDSDINFVPGYSAYESLAIQHASQKPAQDDEEDSSDNADGNEPYADEPLADEEWMRSYYEHMAEMKKVEEKLKQRFECRTDTLEWCTCGNCVGDLLSNPNECHCCREIDECGKSLKSDLVADELPEVDLTCITYHPGFNPVCLQRWSLRLAGDKYKTKEKKRYKQTGSEHRYLRSIAYREFSRLVYGFLGDRRIPLPACAYSAIRKTFPLSEDEEYTGFDFDEEEEEETTDEETTDEDTENV